MDQTPNTNEGTVIGKIVVVALTVLAVVAAAIIGVGAIGGNSATPAPAATTEAPTEPTQPVAEDPNVPAPPTPIYLNTPEGDAVAAWNTRVASGISSVIGILSDPTPIDTWEKELNLCRDVRSGVILLQGAEAAPVESVEAAFRAWTGQLLAATDYCLGEATTLPEAEALDTTFRKISLTGAYFDAFTDQVGLYIDLSKPLGE